ncbi:cation transporter [Xylophilus sp. GW821-FHT01B05]
MSQQFQVEGMSCGHCSQAVQNAVQAADPQAQVKVDLPTGHVDVVSTHSRESLRLAIEGAGYKAS